MSEPELESWHGSYSTSHQELIHAIGMIALQFNYMEHILRTLFLTWFDDEKTGAIVFSKANNEVRIATFNSFVENKISFEPLAGALNHFTKTFSQAYNNRNIVMHSIVTLVKLESGNETTFHLKLQKPKKDTPHKFNEYFVDRDRLRKIADDILMVGNYGRDLVRIIFRCQIETAGWAWPLKPEFHPWILERLPEQFESLKVLEPLSPQTPNMPTPPQTGPAE